MSVEIENPDPSMRLLVANRGEIARRILRAAAKWDVETIAVFADPDADAPFVGEATVAERIGPAALDESYLSVTAIVDAAVRSGATHVHPGYGFLAERSDFATAVVAAGLTWVGPSPRSVESMGSKIEARSVAESAGVPVIPGFNESQSEDDLAAAAGRIGYPILVKASAGGGGKGIRIAHNPDEFRGALRDARVESARAFGDDSVIVERYITRPRHIEVQVAGDLHGNVVELGTRECSVQRRYQKVLEEAPAPNLGDQLRHDIRSAALALASAIGYDSVGTVEFIVDASSNEFFFLEMNTRIQVEHTVTEQVTGIDLIHLQLALACGIEMPLDPDAFDIACGSPARHSAIEVRVNAEDAWNGHLPQIGIVSALDVPEADHLRWDAAIIEGSEISPYYDSMIGKLIVTGHDRIDALDKLSDALDGMRIDGLVTNIDFHRWLIRQQPVRSGRITTRFLDETPLPRASPFGPDAAKSVWSTRWAHRMTPHRSSYAHDSPSRDERWLGEHQDGAASGAVLAPFPGLISEIHVEVGDMVETGQTLLTIEAMKMLHPITAAGTGRIAEVAVSQGDQVDGNQPLITFEVDSTPANDVPDSTES